MGAGAVGAHLAARLARAGANVSLLARGAQLAAIAADGLTLEAPDTRFTVRLPAAASASALGLQDLVFVAVKGPALPAAVDGILPLLKPETPVVYLQNGIPWWYFHGDDSERAGQPIERLDPGGRIWRTLDPRRALGGIVHSSSSISRPGVVRVQRASNRLVIGEPDGSRSDRVLSTLRLLESAGFVAEFASDIRTAIWTKLILNIATGPLAVLTQSALNDLYGEGACVEATRACLLEAHAVATAIGRGEPMDLDDALARVGESRHKPSVLQDLEAGRAMEIDAIYDVPLDFARRAGVETPVLSLLIALTKLRARAAGLYSRAAP